MEVPDEVGRALARPEKCHIRKGVEIYFFIRTCEACPACPERSRGEQRSAEQ